VERFKDRWLSYRRLPKLSGDSEQSHGLPLSATQTDQTRVFHASSAKPHLDRDGDLGNNFTEDLAVAAIPPVFRIGAMRAPPPPVAAQMLSVTQDQEAKNQCEFRKHRFLMDRLRIWKLARCANRCAYQGRAFGAHESAAKRRSAREPGCVEAFSTWVLPTYERAVRSVRCLAGGQSRALV